ncbi:MAG TPA: DUF6789 family protein, partial [Terrimicrobiaceae bacterium]|nr:DUF6789 family protein [Terrimicrobiaceae bacterium]
AAGPQSRGEFRLARPPPRDYAGSVPSGLAPLVGGILGTVAMSALLLLPRWLGMGKIDVIPAVGALITGRTENAFSIGYIVHFVSGIFFAYFYWAVLLLMKLPVVWWMFGMAGFIHGIVVMLLVCITVMEHHPISRYHERGPMTGLAQLLAHIVYGVVVGVVVQALQ